MKTLPFFLFSSLIGVLSLPTLSYAGTITKNTDKKVILDFEGEDIPAPQDRVFVLDQESHKEIGLVEIIKTKGSRALGKLIKGNAKPGDTTDIARTKRKKEEDREPAEDTNMVANETPHSAKKHSSRISYGIGADFVYTSLYLKNSAGEGNITGNGFGVRGAVDIPINSNWVFFGSLALHPYNVTSTGSYTLNISTNFLGFEGLARYILDKRNEGLWLGGGLGYYLPMSSNEDPKPKSELVVIGSAGYNVRLSRDYFTLKGDFIMFQPKSSSGSTAQVFQVVMGGVYFF